VNEDVDGVGARLTGSSDREFKGRGRGVGRGVGRRVGRGVERGVVRGATRGVGDKGQNSPLPGPPCVAAVSLVMGVLRGAQSDAV
jgi:hypothetical protein